MKETQVLIEINPTIGAVVSLLLSSVILLVVYIWKDNINRNKADMLLLHKEINGIEKHQIEVKSSLTILDSNYRNISKEIDELKDMTKNHSKLLQQNNITLSVIEEWKRHVNDKIV